MAESYPNSWKTLSEKEKLLITSNFAFSQSVFKRLVLQTHKKKGLFGKGLILYHAMWLSPIAQSIALRTREQVAG